MDDWGFFDAWCVLGRHLKWQPGSPHTPEELLAEMDYLGIREALVLDCLSRENHPADGNRRILDVTAGRPRLHPAWSALPTGASDEQPDPETFRGQMDEHRVGALFLFPKQYRFTLSDWCIDALLEPLAEAAVPVFINYNEVGRGGWGWDETDWEAVVAVCRRWPGLPVIVSEWRIRRANRLIYRALDACENLHIELSGYWLHRGIEYITEHWGARRLLFGSGWPWMGQACTLTTLTTAEIADADKRRIAGDNLRDLIRWCERSRGSAALPCAHEVGPSRNSALRRAHEVGPSSSSAALVPGDILPHAPHVGPTSCSAASIPGVHLPAPADEFVAFARTGRRPPEMTFADCHGHLGGRACHYHLPDCTIEGIVADMDRFGIEKVCAFSFAVVFSDERFGNDLVAEAVRRFPERFVGFAGLNLHRGRDEMLRELQRCADLGLRGIKLIPWYQDFPEEHPLLEAPCQWAHDRRQIILNHNWGPPEQVQRLVSAYPNACFFTGHATSAYADIMKRHPNLFVCSCPVFGPGDCERLVEAVGADRLLFGSDLQDLPIAWGLGPILCARLTVQEKRLILGENLRRILTRYSLAGSA